MSKSVVVGAPGLVLKAQDIARVARGATQDIKIIIIYIFKIISTEISDWRTFDTSQSAHATPERQTVDK